MAESGRDVANNLVSGIQNALSYSGIRKKVSDTIGRWTGSSSKSKPSSSSGRDDSWLAERTRAATASIARQQAEDRAAAAKSKARKPTPRSKGRR